MSSRRRRRKSVRNEVVTLIESQTKRLVNDLDLVPGDLLEAIKTIAMSARMEVERLHERLVRFELAGTRL